MKRRSLFSLFLILCLVLSLSACAAGGSVTDAGSPDATKESKLVNGTLDATREPADATKESSDGKTKDTIAGVDEATKPLTIPGKATLELAPDSPILAFGEAGGAVEGLPSSRYDSGYIPDPKPVEPVMEPAAVDPGYNSDIPTPEPVPPVTIDDAEPLVLTAAEWNDNLNWPFFTNLVNSGIIHFPSFGLDPRYRLKVTVTDDAGNKLANETVRLLDESGSELWKTKTDKSGTAFLFWQEGETPDLVTCGEASEKIMAEAAPDGPQGVAVMQPREEVTLVTGAAAAASEGLQVMFIVDTTGSMGDELAYLQKDFSAIAARVGTENVSWSVSFYRDEGDAYVTNYGNFQSDVGAIQARFAEETANGGGDEPEAVAEILEACLTNCTEWQETTNKVAFLIFDAPPHEGSRQKAMLQTAVKTAAAKGIHVVPVVASNASRDTEMFGRALAICTNGTYVFLTDDSGVGDSHLEPIVGAYTVELLQDVLVRIIESYR